jgi:hypothetical protein
MDKSRSLRKAISFVVVRGGTSMNVATIGLDIAKHIFQVHGADAEEQGLNNRLGSNRRDPSDGKNVPSVPPDLAGAQSLLDFAFNRNAGQRHEAQPVGRTIQDELGGAAPASVSSSLLAFASNSDQPPYIRSSEKIGDRPRRPGSTDETG